MTSTQPSNLLTSEEAGPYQDLATVQRMWHSRFFVVYGARRAAVAENFSSGVCCVQSCSRCSWQLCVTDCKPPG